MNYCNIAATSGVQTIVDNLLPELPGIHGSVIVAKQAHILYHENFTSHGNMKTDKNAQHLIASVTKNFTSVAILKLLSVNFGEDIDYALNKPLSGFLGKDHPIWQGIMPDFARGITIHHLLSHTSGLEAIDKPLLHTPGTRYHYSNLGYVLIGHIIQSLTPEPIDVYYKRVLFDPAGMHDTFLVVSGIPVSLKDKPDFAALRPGFKKDGLKITKVIDKPNFGTLFTAGGMISTPIDLVRWQNALYQGHVIPLKLLSGMTNPIIQKSGFAFYDGEGPLFSGYGVDIVGDGVTKIYQYCGGTSGY
ncbi:MAG: hypothetical protein BGO07_01195 [Alphaproteobacteria bacterium 40-19]|nr:MAG: hypothetical protein BGO07_01195 [Alphaproteobacteria bacterium 40-19]